MLKMLVDALYQKMFMRQLDMRKKMGSRQYSDLFLRNITSDLVMLVLIWRVWTILAIPNQTPYY